VQQERKSEKERKREAQGVREREEERAGKGNLDDLQVKCPSAASILGPHKR
jgi:hypothetical protein